MMKTIQNLIQAGHLEYYQNVIKGFEGVSLMQAAQATHSLIINVEDEFIQTELIKVWGSYLEQLYMENPTIAVKQAEYSARAAPPVSNFQLYAESLFSRYKHKLNKIEEGLQ